MNKTRVKSRLRAITNKTIEVITTEGITIEIDALMKPILLHLWNRGIITLNCCAGYCITEME